MPRTHQPPVPSGGLAPSPPGGLHVARHDLLSAFTLFSSMAAGMLPLHMRNSFRPEFLEKSGALLFIWTLYALGVNDADVRLRRGLLPSKTPR